MILNLKLSAKGLFVNVSKLPVSISASAGTLLTSIFITDIEKQFEAEEVWRT